MIEIDPKYSELRRLKFKLEQEATVNRHRQKNGRIIVGGLSILHFGRLEHLLNLPGRDSREIQDEVAGVRQNYCFHLGIAVGRNFIETKSSMSLISLSIDNERHYRLFAMLESWRKGDRRMDGDYTPYAEEHYVTNAELEILSSGFDSLRRHAPDLLRGHTPTTFSAMARRQDLLDIPDAAKQADRASAFILEVR